MSQETTITRRTRFGAKTEVLLGERGGDRALRISDLDSVVAPQIMEVLAANGLRLSLSGSGVGFNGTTAIPKPTLPAAATDPASTMALVNSIRAALIAYGLAS